MLVPKNKFGIKACFSIPKSTDGYPNEDFCARSTRKGIVGISDGASISYDSATWARLVAVNYVKDPTVCASWIRRAISEYETTHDRSTMSWMAQAAYDRGSFASLLGVKFGEGISPVEIFAIGDSLAVLCDGDRILSTYPYSVPEEFDARPVLLSTDYASNVFLKTEGFPASNTIFWNMSELVDPLLVCVTDALGLWILTEREALRNPIGALRGITSRRQFSKFVEDERRVGRMRRDDTTLVALQ